jgi:hypothetical protein
VVWEGGARDPRAPPIPIDVTETDFLALVSLAIRNPGSCSKPSSLVLSNLSRNWTPEFKFGTLLSEMLP